MNHNQTLISKLERQLSAQTQLIESLSAKVSLLEERNAILEAKNALLEAKNALLEEELSLYRVKKDSSNSSIAPSHDPNRVKRTTSLREKSGLKPGGQPGHEGSCLEMSDEPSQTVIHAPAYCTCCGNDLSDVPSFFIGRRQVVDIPPVTPVITEHQIHGKRCGCGQLIQSDYPAHAHSPVCYGSNIQALTAYLHSRQYIPFERMREMYRDIFSLDISSGSLVNMIQSIAHKADDIYGEIRRRVSSSPVVGADETGCRVNGKNSWAWVFQTPAATYIHVDKSRGRKVVNELFPDGFPKAVFVHDCWSSYFGVQTRRHQICTAHLLRELKYLDKLYPGQQWSSDFTAMLRSALELKKTLTAADYSNDALEERLLLEAKLDHMLELSVDMEHKQLVVFKNRIQKYRDYLFSFLYFSEVPPDNNASERAIRTFKVKQKVSGVFRAEGGAKNFAVIRSVIDTTIKNGQNVWEALTALAVIPKKIVKTVKIMDDS